MLKLLAALALSLALTAPADAATRTLTAHQSAPGRLIGGLDATTVVTAVGWQDPTRVDLHGDDGKVRTVFAPAGCGLTAAGSGLLAGECGPAKFKGDGSGTVEEHLVVVASDGTVKARIDPLGSASPVEGIEPSAPTAVGENWIALRNTSHGGSYTEAVNWHTLQVLERRDTDLGAYDDLDRPGLAARLCSPLRRVATDYGRDPFSYPVVVDGRWALIGGYGIDGDFRLRRCGSARTVTLLSGLVPVGLQNGWMLGVKGKTAYLARLADRRLFKLVKAGTVTRETRLVVTERRAYLDNHDSVVRAVRLP